MLDKFSHRQMNELQTMSSALETPLLSTGDVTQSGLGSRQGEHLPDPPKVIPAIMALSFPWVTFLMSHTEHSVEQTESLASGIIFLNRSFKSYPFPL